MTGPAAVRVVVVDDHPLFRQGIGAQFILVSHSGSQEIKDALEVAKDWSPEELCRRYVEVY